MHPAFSVSGVWKVGRTGQERARVTRTRPRVCACAGRPRPEGEEELLKGPGGVHKDYAHLAPEERAAMIELDAFAEEWIGCNISRWEWYERMKHRRQRMLDDVRKREAALNREMDELKNALMDLDTLMGLGFISGTDSKITPAGWTAVALVALCNFLIAYTAFELVSNAVMGAFPPSPF